jgi:hypothetical protein
MPPFALIAPARDYGAVYDQHCAHRHLALSRCVPGIVKGERHEAMVLTA